MYEATWDSVGTHEVPDWYEDAKLGVFVHWGLYSVPGWAPRVPDIQRLLVERGPWAMLRENPYAEWYLNSMQVRGSPTQRHHREVYGDGYPYDRFVQTFDSASSRADLHGLADLCQAAGARYVVLTTKHHDGFALWPAATEHPVKGAYHARRDLVAELAQAVRTRHMRMGLYYSGGYDWPYNRALLSRAGDAVLAAPQDDRYRAYVSAHVRELIDRYAPSVLWNDISWPAGGNLAELFAYYYNQVEDGVVNDRWLEPTIPRNRVTEFAVMAGGELLQMLWRFIPEQRKHLTFANPRHCDFRTPEYEASHDLSEKKWELARGLGHSFGANRHELAEDIISETELITLFCDVVAKNGNLLIGVGPRPDGTIPELQQAPLRGLGSWLAANGEAIYGSRPWVMPASETTDGTSLRFTQSGGVVYALVLGTPRLRRLTLRDVDGSALRRVRLLGTDELLEWSDDDGQVSIALPERVQLAAVTALDLGEGARARSR